MKIPSLLIPILVSTLCAGCTADKRAALAAGHITQAVAGYESAVDTKVNAEKAFYHDQLQNLRVALGGNSAVSDPTDPNDRRDIRLTLPYGRILTAANRDARILAEQIVNKPEPEGMQQIMSFVDAGVKEQQADFLGYLERQRKLVTQLSDELTPIDQQKERLATVRTQLATLSKPKSALKQVEDVVRFGQGALDLAKDQKP